MTRGRRLAALYRVLEDTYLGDWRDMSTLEHFFKPTSDAGSISSAAAPARQGHVCWKEVGQLHDDSEIVEGESNQIRSGEWCQRIAKAFKKCTRAGFEGKHRLWLGDYVPEKIIFTS